MPNKVSEPQQPPILPAAPSKWAAIYGQGADRITEAIKQNVEVENSFGKRMADGKVKDRLHQKLKGAKGPGSGRSRDAHEKPTNAKEQYTIGSMRQELQGLSKGLN